LVVMKWSWVHVPDGENELGIRLMQEVIWMKKWITPDMVDLSAEWTQNVVNTEGADSYGETGFIPGVGDVELGSCC